ncbi:MAG: cob(I)yrinic acid a,c-diamide adenosyltransferase [Desulfosarcina sp.]|nr:cob(I)yrinic acid a,c-diamide adenosyltransferase [Desulfobacterales bacterium]
MMQKAVRRHLPAAITGRGAPKKLLSATNRVAKMRTVKHPLQAGLKAPWGDKVVRQKAALHDY